MLALYGLLCTVFAGTYSWTVTVSNRTRNPILIYPKMSIFQQTFNPGFVEPSDGTNNTEGLLIRVQNCTDEVGTCVHCSGVGQKASQLAFSRLHPNGVFDRCKNIVFGPHANDDERGTEDPRVKYNPFDKQYYIFYTCYGVGAPYLCLATTPDPTTPSNWNRHGYVFPSTPNSKSAALMIRGEHDYHLYWGAGEIRHTTSTNSTVWPNIGELFLTPRKGYFDDNLVEAGPPPIQLLNGHWLFIYNSDNGTCSTPQSTGAYQTGWVIIDKDDPTKILARAETPILAPVYAWEIGVAPYPCNVPHVVFVQAMKRISTVEDTFEIFYNGGDLAIGSVLITVTQ